MTSARLCLLDWLEALPPGLPYSRALVGPPPPPSWSGRERTARESKQPEPGKSSSGSVGVPRGSRGEDAALIFVRGVSIGATVLGPGNSQFSAPSAPSRLVASLPGLLPPPAGLLPLLKAARESGGGSGPGPERGVGSRCVLQGAGGGGSGLGFGGQGPGMWTRWGCEAGGGRAGLGQGPGPGRRGALSVGHWVFFSSGPCLRVADMTAPAQSPLAPLLETLEDPSAPHGEQTDAYLTLTR